MSDAVIAINNLKAAAGDLAMNSISELFDRQKRHFATGVTRSREWRIDQLDRMARLITENEVALQKAIERDFKTASQEQIFETQACIAETVFQKSQLDEWMKPPGWRPTRGSAVPLSNSAQIFGVQKHRSPTVISAKSRRG